MRAGIYVRVSSEEQVPGYSLDAQARLARDYCEAHGWTVVEEYRDEGRSARSDDAGTRPAFARMLADAEVGRLDVVVVHKLDRFARSRRVAFEALDRLGRARVGFVSLSEQMDYSTPQGQLMLTMLVGMGQFYSDNLSTETKKGKAERKRQGLYNGVLPFGVQKDSTGIPVPDPENYQGLLLAFGEAAKGTSDRDVAVRLNDAGYRTTGNRGRNPFTKDTVRVLLQNRFYLGELPDGDGGWIDGAHEPLLDDDLFAAAQEARERRAQVPMPVRRQATTYSLSGLLRCHHCGGSLHLHRDKGRVRAYCYQGRQGVPCPQRSTFLDVYETQVLEYLDTFKIPVDYRPRLIAAQAEIHPVGADAAGERRRLERQLANLRTLFELGDLTKDDFLARRERLRRTMDGLRTHNKRDEALERAAAFLGDVPAAWLAATDAQRNALARLLFREVRIKDDWVVAVGPQPSFAPFFELDCQTRRLSGGSDGGRGRVLEFLAPRRHAVPDLRPRRGRASCGSGTRYAVRGRRLAPEQEAAIRASGATRSLRALAADFGVSHETIRSVVRLTRNQGAA